MANVYPNNIIDYEERAHNQNKAKGICNAIIAIFQLVSRELKFNVNRYSELIKLCNTEYSDIKGWLGSLQYLKVDIAEKVFLQ